MRNQRITQTELKSFAALPRLIELRLFFPHVSPLFLYAYPATLPRRTGSDVTHNFRRESVH